MADLSAYILALNETENVPSLMESLKGINDVVVLDNGSTDGTQELFRAHGARVYDGTKIGKHLVTEEDVSAFREQFGYDPQFAAGAVFDDSGERRNHAASLCRHDWVVNPDCDERPEWELPKVKAMLNGQPSLRHRYIHKHNPDGSPLVEFVQSKIYHRRRGRYVGRIHEVLMPTKETRGIISPFCPDFVLHHWQKERPYRDNHTDQMEFQALRDGTPRNLHYLGREYADHGQFEKGLAIYERYFAHCSSLDFPEQVGMAYLVQADCFMGLQRVSEAIEACHRAMPLDYKRRAPFFQLGQIYMELNQYDHALIYFTAASAIPYNPQGYMNDMRMYTWGLHDKLSCCYQQLGKPDIARAHWLEAMKHLPDGPDGARILANGRGVFGAVRGEAGDEKS